MLVRIKGVTPHAVMVERVPRPGEEAEEEVNEVPVAATGEWRVVGE